MIVVSDTTALTNLFQVHQLPLLKEIFGKVLIPPAVEQELSEMPGQLDKILALDFIEVVRPKDTSMLSHLRLGLDDGEAEAIALAIEVNADYLIIDEWKGRRVAKDVGLHVIGLVGVLLTAKRMQKIPEIKPILQELVEQAGFRLHPGLIRDVLRDAGEAVE